MRILLAGATGVIGLRLAALLRDSKHQVIGTTRTPAKGPMLRALGVMPVVVDVFDPDALAHAVTAARADVIVHQLTDLPSAPGTAGYPAAQEANRRLRVEGTRNLMQAARMAGVRRVVAQSIAFVYAPGEGAHVEDDPLDVAADPGVETGSRQENASNQESGAPFRFESERTLPSGIGSGPHARAIGLNAVPFLG